MRYDEKEELESTKEWLLRFNEAGFSDELLYVPSQLTKMGVAPIDVVDRLDWLREQGRGIVKTTAKVASRTHRRADVLAVEQQAAPVLVLERPQEDPEPEVEPLPEQEELVLIPQPESETPMTAIEPLVFDYDSYGPWEWAAPIEQIMEDAFKAVLDPEPGLHQFNELALLTRQRKGQRRRGKSARTALAVTVSPERRVDELVSSNSGATE